MIDAGDAAPAFRLPDHTGTEVTLPDLLNGGLIIFFYPRAMTPGCTKEACDFRDGLKPLESAGYRVVGISPDPPELNARFVEKESLTYALLSDEDHEVASAFGAWGIRKNYGKEYEGIIRSTFVVDGQGTLTRAYRNVRATGHVARVTEDLLG